MKLDKFLALSAYAVQAFATLGLVFAVSRLLSGAEYGHYSLIVASAQSAAVLGFEWVRLAAARFCANTAHDDVRPKKDTIQFAFALATLVIGVLVAVAVALGAVGIHEAMLGLIVAVLIGLTDLLLVFLRTQGSFNQFAMLQMLRAFTLLACSIIGAYKSQSALGALTGLAFGYGFSLLVYILAAPAWWVWRFSNVRSVLFKEMAVYGVSVAAASNIHLQVPLLVRWVGKAFLSAEGFAGLSLAMDILQKPFALVTSAIGGVLTPAVIVEFEKGQDLRSPKLRQIYEIQIWAVLLLLGLSIAFLPDVASLVVRAEMQTWVVQFGPPVAIMFAAHALIQSTIAIPGHLLHKGLRLIVHATFELACVALFICGALYFDFLRPFLWVWLGCLAAALSIFFAFPLVKEVPCDRPVQAVYFAITVSALLGALYLLPTQTSFLLMGLKVVLALVICATGVWAYKPYFRRASIEG